MDDAIAISVRDVGKMYHLYNRPQDRLKQAFLWGRKKFQGGEVMERAVVFIYRREPSRPFSVKGG